MIERTMHSDRIRYIGKGRARRSPSGRLHRDTTVDVPARRVRQAPRSRRGAHAPRPGPVTRPDTDGFVRYDERALGVRRALDRIPDPVDRQIIVLRFFVGLSIEEIARRLRRPLENVRARYRFAVERLARDLRPYLR